MDWLLTRLIRIGLLVGTLGFAAFQFQNLNAGKHPDVVMIVIDDLNDWIPLLDKTSPIEMPNLKRLASAGMTFTRAYCASPACNPSRVATLTGIRPSNSGVYGNRSDWRKAMPKRRTIMQRFRDSGYAIYGAGKVFHHHLDGAFHDPQSFDEFRPMNKQQYPKSKLNQAPSYGSRNTDWGAWPPHTKETIDYATTSYCVQKIHSNSTAERSGSPPMFLVCGLYKPHSPFFAPEEYHRPYRKITLPVRNKTDWNDLPSGATALLESKKWFYRGMMQVDREMPGSYQRFISSYAACATFVDSQVGRLLDAIDNQDRPTLIVLWSDHGFHLGEKDHIEKFALWEKSTRVPLIFSGLGIPPGSTCNHPVDLMSLYPTLLELCGLAEDPQCDGVSIAPLLSDLHATWDRPAVMTYGRGNHAVRSHRWRYIRYSDGSEELYDHRNDPHEWTNVAARFNETTRSLQRWLPNQEKPQVDDLRK